MLLQKRSQWWMQWKWLHNSSSLFTPFPAVVLSLPWPRWSCSSRCRSVQRVTSLLPRSVMLIVCFSSSKVPLRLIFFFCFLPCFYALLFIDLHLHITFAFLNMEWLTTLDTYFLLLLVHLKEFLPIFQVCISLTESRSTARSSGISNVIQPVSLFLSPHASIPLHCNLYPRFWGLYHTVSAFLCTTPLS